MNGDWQRQYHSNCLNALDCSEWSPTCGSVQVAFEVITIGNEGRFEPCERKRLLPHRTSSTRLQSTSNLCWQTSKLALCWQSLHDKFESDIDGTLTLHDLTLHDLTLHDPTCLSLSVVALPLSATLCQHPQQLEPATTRPRNKSDFASKRRVGSSTREVLNSGSETPVSLAFPCRIPPKEA